MSAVLYQIEGGLYAASAAGGTAVFVLAKPPTPPPPTLQVASLWTDKGPPENPGWFVFTDQPINTSGASAAEKALREMLAVGTTTGIAWVNYQGGATASMLASIATALDPDNTPRIAADAPLPTPAGLLASSFAADAPVRGLAGPDGLEALVVGVPSAATGGVRSVGGQGAAIVLFGDSAGCVRFDALIGQPPAQGATVALMRVSIYPLDPFDIARNYETFTGTQYLFTSGPNGWHLVADGG
jgi:hypothetical protein